MQHTMKMILPLSPLAYHCLYWFSQNDCVSDKRKHYRIASPKFSQVKQSIMWGMTLALLNVVGDP